MSGLYRRGRRRLGRWRRQVVDPNDLAGRLARQREQSAQQATRTAKQVAELKATVTALARRLKPVELASSHREVEHGLLTIQVGVLEQRVARLEDALRTERFAGDDAEHAEAASLVEAVRREHEQIRVRMQVIAQYEERLRRMEAAVVALYDGDVRHPF